MPRFLIPPKSLILPKSLIVGAVLLAACQRPAPAPVAATAAGSGTTAGAQPSPGAATETAAPAFAATGHPNLPGFVRPLGPVATVNGRDIPAERFNREFDKLVGTGARIPSDRLQKIARNILGKLIETELREQAIRNESVALSEAEFEAAWREFTARFDDAEGRFDDAAFQAELERTRSSIEQMRAQVREQRLARKLVEKLGRIDISEADLRGFYDQNPSAWVEPSSRDVRPILVRVPPDANASQRDLAAQKAKDASAALRKGADFEQTAQLFGGEVRPPIHLVRGSADPELEAAAFALKVGEVSVPVKSRWGWYVLRLIEKNEQRERPFAEVRDEIRKTLLSRRTYLEDRRIVQELRRKAEVVEKLPF